MAESLLTRELSSASQTLPWLSRPPFSIYSLTLVLAYLQRHCHRAVPYNRLLSPQHCQQLVEWLGFPQVGLKSFRQHRLLTAHLVTLCALELLTMDNQLIQLAPQTSCWLRLPPEAKKEQVGQLIMSESWERTVIKLGVIDMMDEPYRHYLKQQLARATSEPAVVSATWVAGDPEVWQLQLREEMPASLLFDLLQLGEWSPGHPLTLTPYSLAVAVTRGYGCEQIRWLLETATAQPLASKQLAQLVNWTDRSQSYRWSLTPLLITQQPEQLAAILTHRRLKVGVVEQLSPRVACIQQEALPKIERWLAKQGYPLAGPMLADSASAAPERECPTAQAWLGLRVLMGLGELIPLPVMAPVAARIILEEQLSAQLVSELELVAQATIQAVRSALHGRDAFFPAYEAAAAETIAQLKRAIAQEQCVQLLYQALGDREPRQRRVQPLRLETYGNLHYLIAYCFRAEATLTFRLDRIHRLDEEENIRGTLWPGSRPRHP